jgi:hypothetical protein
MDIQSVSGFRLRRGHESMLMDLMGLAICALMALLAFGVVAWEAATGRFLTMDGLWLTLIALALGMVFGGNIVWSIYTGDLQKILSRHRKDLTETSASEENSQRSK